MGLFSCKSIRWGISQCWDIVRQRSKDDQSYYKERSTNSLNRKKTVKAHYQPNIKPPGEILEAFLFSSIKSPVEDVCADIKLITSQANRARLNRPQRTAPLTSWSRVLFLCPFITEFLHQPKGAPMSFAHIFTAGFMPRDVYQQPSCRQLPKQKPCLEVSLDRRS